LRPRKVFLRISRVGVEITECRMAKKCTRQPVLTAVRIVKFPSSPTRTGQFIAESAIRNEDHHEDTKPIKLTS